MMRPNILLVCIASLALASCAPSSTDGGTDTAAPSDDGAPYPMLEPRYDMRVEQAVRVPMRDGVRLSTDLHFPDGAPEVDLDAITNSLPLIDMMQKANRPHTDWESILSYGLADPLVGPVPLLQGLRADRRPHPLRQFVARLRGERDALAVQLLPGERGIEYRPRQPVRHHLAGVALRLGAHQPPTLVGERDLGDARYDFWTLYVRWYDYWLKGEDNGVTDMPPVQYYLMGRNEWRAADEWPVAGTQFTRYYPSGGAANSLNGDGVLTTEAPLNGAVDRYTYDPGAPTPSLSGSYGMEEGFYDQRPVEERDDAVHHSPEYPSHVLLPIVPEGASRLLELN